jgi:hypothetical protein
VSDKYFLSDTLPLLTRLPRPPCSSMSFK